MVILNIFFELKNQLKLMTGRYSQLFNQPFKLLCQILTVKALNDKLTGRQPHSPGAIRIIRQ
jgi:hypothetical protein